MNPIDLQIQTTASDGKHSPAECVEMAKQNGVHTIAITDHDTVAGVPEALAAGAKFGVRVIPGIEISVGDHGIHMLAIGIDIENDALRAAMERAAESRIRTAKAIVEKLNGGGFVVTWEDVLREAAGAVVVRPHIAEAVLKRPENREKLGGVTTKREFFETFFSDQGPYYVRHSTVTARDTIRLIHDAGGVAVWSHPPIPEFVGQCAVMEEFLKELITYGLDGLEVFSPSHTESDTACLDGLAERYHLLRSAGSDFHERHNRIDEPWPRPASTIGDYPTYGRSIDGIVGGIDQAFAGRRIARGT